MTMATRTARRSRSALVFLAAVLTVALGLIAAGPASVLTASTAQNAVGATAAVGADQRLGNDAPQPQIVVATGVAANTPTTTKGSGAGMGDK